MFVCTLKFDRKKAIFTVIMVALVLFGLIMLVTIDTDNSTEEEAPARVASEEKGAQYLSSLGWKAELPALSVENVLIPKSFSDVFNKYNELQLSQGFDLSQYAGKEVRLYTYKITNHESSDSVLAELYVYKNQVIGGDIHSSALDGFMHGLKKAVRN